MVDTEDAPNIPEDDAANVAGATAAIEAADVILDNDAEQALNAARTEAIRTEREVQLEGLEPRLLAFLEQLPDDIS